MGSSNPTEASAKKRGLLLRVALGLLVLVGSLIALVWAQKTPPTKADAIDARLELAAGEVTLTEGETKTTVVSGIPLPSGAGLSTGKGARALLRLSDGSRLFLRGDTELSIGATGIELQKGEVWLDAPAVERDGAVHKLGDTTVSAVDAGLSIKREGADISVYVARGLAVVTSPGGRVEVNAGEEAKVSAAAAPKVEPVAFWDDWTGGMGDRTPSAGEGSGAGRLYGIDPFAAPGTSARTLEISRQSVRAVVRDGLAETEVDQTFSNPGGRQVEGWYWFTVPERAIVTSFAVETDGMLIEGEVIERKEAAARYAAAVQSAHEPALLEWIDGRSYRARIFPVPASGARRVVLRYLELLPARSGKLDYVYPMGSTDPAEIGEFSLVVDLGDEGLAMKLATVADAVVEDGGRRVTMRRSGYSPRADFQLEAVPRKAPATLRIARFSTRGMGGEDRADYLMARLVPEVDWTGMTSLRDQPADLVVVVDTSASADESARQQKASAAEAILRALSSSDHFALVALDSAPTVLYPKEGLADATSDEIAKGLERLAEHATGGATDLGALFDTALGLVHGKEQPAVIYIGDGLPTSGEVSGDKLAERLRRSFSESRARFFTVAVGNTANRALLGELSRAGGGQPFRIDDMPSATSEVLRLAAAIKTPTITDLVIDLGAGLDEPMITASGKVSRGEEVVLFARTHHALPDVVTVKGRVGGQDFSREHKVELDSGIGAALVPRLWAAEKMRRLLGEGEDPEAHRGKVVELGVEYGLVTPFTSILALESEAAYAQQGIQRKSSVLRGVRLTRLDASQPSIERSLVESLSPLAPRVAFGCAQEGAPASVQTDVATSPVAQNKPSSPMAVATAATEAVPMAPAEPEADPSGFGFAQVAKEEQARPAVGAPRAKAANIDGKDDLGRIDEDGLVAERRQLADAPPPPPAAPRPMDASKKRAEGTLSVGAATTGAGGRAAGTKSLADLAGKRGANASPARSTLQPLSQCSDMASRPLVERIVMWAKRLRGATGSDDLLARYEGARSTCEIPDWRAQSALIELIVAKVQTEGAAAEVLAFFSGERETQRFVAHALLRRAVDPRMAAVVRRALFEDDARWVIVDEELAGLETNAARIAKLREILLVHPGDPEGELRLVRLLADSGQKDEALAYGRRLRDQGFMSPALALRLGDVLAASGFEEDAIRTYSEIVEFEPDRSESRRALGDVYLRHGWYQAAYRQYKTLVDIAPSEPSSLLRLAAAAAGAERTDEALRIQRQVASAEGIPGPSDPRLWARLLSAARLGRLLSGGDAVPEAQRESLSRKLKEMQLFSGPAALVILTWEDFDASLAVASIEGDREVPIGELTEGAEVGLSSVLLSLPDLDRVGWRVRWRDDPPGRDVPFAVETIRWDGKKFEVKRTEKTLPAKDRDITL